MLFFVSYLQTYLRNSDDRAAVSYGSGFWTVCGEDSNVFGGDIAACDSYTRQDEGCGKVLHFRANKDY